MVDHQEANEYVRVFLVGYDQMRKIQAIKQFRQLRMAGLREAKEVIDRFQRGDQDPIYQGLMPRFEAEEFVSETPHLWYEFRPVVDLENVDLSKL